MSEKIRILYIDDYELDRELVKDALEREHGGFEVMEASDRREFETLLKTHPFDLVLSDFNIAGFEGLQVLEAVRTHDPRLPVIIVTGTGSEEIAVKALKQGVSDYVIKRPKHIQRLPQTIFAAIEKQRLKNQRQADELALKESERRYRSLFENMINGYAYCRMIFENNKPQDFIFLDVNRSFETATGLKNIAGKKVSEVIPGIQESDPELFEAYGRVALTGVPEQFEIYVKALSMWLLVSVYCPEKDHFVAVFDVINERKQNEESLRSSERRLRLAQQCSGAGIWDWDIDSGRLDWSRELFVLFGLDPDKTEPNFDLWDQVLHPDDKEEAYGRIEKAIKQGTTLDNEYRINHPSGQVRWIKALGNTIYDQEKRPVRMTGMCIDITERKKAEEALKESEEKYRNILENVLVGVYQVALDGKILFVNQKMTEMFGYASSKDLKSIGSIAELYVRPEERGLIVDEILSKGFVHDEYEFRRKDGKHIWVRLHTRKTENKEGKIILEGLMEDITEFKKMETRLQQSQRLEAIGTLAGGIAHDFNNILSAVIGFAELSLDDVEPGSLLHTNLTEILIAGNRAKDLVKQILTFSRKGEQEKKPIQLTPMVLEAIRMLRSTISANIAIKEQVCSEKLTINANPSQMNQVLLNLATNASHAVGENGVIEIGVQGVILDENSISQYPDLLPGRYAKIYVSDNGCGIAKENLDLIFDPYFSTKSPDKGTGLGLAVVHGIVKIHGGHITVYSEIDKGTTFHIYLPLYEQAVAAELSRPAKPFPVGKERILLVDDEPAIVKMQKQVLERWGYTVVDRTSSMDALETFRAAPGSFDLIITDMTMSGLNGDKLAQSIKAIRPDIPVILCTGFSENVNVETAKDIMIDGFLMKPVDKEKMAKMIRDVLALARKRA